MNMTASAFNTLSADAASAKGVAETDKTDLLRKKFSAQGVASKWHDMYSTDTERLDEINYRKRRDLAIEEVLKVVDADSRVLDLGCGAGPVISELRQRGVNTVGMDYSEDMLNFARARLRSKGLDDSGLRQGDCRKTPYPDAGFDVVVCLGVISYIPDVDVALQQIERILKPGGTLILSFRNVFNPLASDPVALGKRLVRKLMRNKTSDVAPPFEMGQFLDHRQVTAEIEKLGFNYVNFFGIGFGPFCLAGRRLFSERQSIQINQWLTRLCFALHLRRSLRWVADVSLWVYQKPTTEDSALRRNS